MILLLKVEGFGFAVSKDLKNLRVVVYKDVLK